MGSQEEYDLHRRQYAVWHPPPELRRLSFVNEVGLDAALTVVTVLAAVVLSAIRTGTIFAITEAELLNGHSWFGWLDGVLPALAALAALVAVEGTLVVAGYIRARNMERQDIPPFVVLLALATVIMAGGRASLTLLSLPEDDPVVTGVTWTLAALTAVAPPLIAYYGGHIIGAVHVRWDALVRKARQDYENEMKEWESSLYRSFLARRRGRLAFANERDANERTRTFVNERERSRTNANGANVREREETNANVHERTNGMRTNERLRALAFALRDANGQWPGPSALARALAEERGEVEYEKYKSSAVAVLRGITG